jgi:hypothetical protein
LRQLPREGSGPLVDLVELEAGSELCCAVVVEELVGLLVVQDRTSPEGEEASFPTTGLPAKSFS